MRHFIDLEDAGAAGIAAILTDAAERKAARAGWPKGQPDADAPLAGHVLAMVFEKNSTRTRVSFDMAMRQLGGSALLLDGGSSQIGRGESIADTARVLSRYLDAIMIRTDDHSKVVEMAKYASVPVINGLTDASHPCQLLSDMQTVIERKGQLAGTRWAWLGDGNNVCNSLIEAAALMKFELRVACPPGHKPEAVLPNYNPREAVLNADVVVTDTWTSMGQAESKERLAAFAPYRVDNALMEAAGPDAIFLHCLPAHRGEEVTDAVLDGPQSAAWDEAENRLHAQKSLLLWVMGKL
ncbi:MAG: ornithine carbamoyltransferase [Sphingomicrobium sp.]